MLWLYLCFILLSSSWSSVQVMIMVSHNKAQTQNWESYSLKQGLRVTLKANVPPPPPKNNKMCHTQVILANHIHHTPNNNVLCIEIRYSVENFSRLVSSKPATSASQSSIEFRVMGWMVFWYYCQPKSKSLRHLLGLDFWPDNRLDTLISIQNSILVHL